MAITLSSFPGAKAPTSTSGRIKLSAFPTIKPVQRTQPSDVRTGTLPPSLGGGRYNVGEPFELIKSPRGYGGIESPGEYREHIFPVALGGTSSADNIKVYGKDLGQQKSNYENQIIRDYKANKITLAEARGKVLHKFRQLTGLSPTDKEMTAKGQFLPAFKESAKKTFGGLFGDMARILLPKSVERKVGLSGEVDNEKSRLKESTRIALESFKSGMLTSAKSFLPTLVTPEQKRVFDKGALRILNDPAVAPVMKEVARRTSGTGVVSMVQAAGPKTFEEAYKANREAQAGDPSKMKKFLYQLGDTAPQTALGVALNFIPYAGKPLSVAYWTSLSASEQLESKGEVTSTTNIGIDVVLDSILGKSLEGLLKTPKKTLLSTIKKSFWVEGGTEVAQDLLKMANSYGEAKSPQERANILEDAKEYFTSGQILMTLGVGGITGAGIGGVAQMAGQNVTRPDIVNVPKTFKTAPITEEVAEETIAQTKEDPDFVREMENQRIFEQAPPPRPNTIRVYNTRSIGDNVLRAGNSVSTDLAEQGRWGEPTDTKISYDIPRIVARKYLSLKDKATGVYTIKTEVPKKYLSFESQKTPPVDAAEVKPAKKSEIKQITEEDVEKFQVAEKPTIKKVPREQLPVKVVEGKKKVSRLESRVKETLGNLSDESIDKLGLATYNQVNNKENIKMASEYVVNNEEEAMDVLLGKKQAPKGILRNSIFIAMQSKATQDFNRDLALKLASLESTRFGQEISVLQELDEFSSVSAVEKLIKIHEKALLKRTGKTKKQVKSKQVKSVKDNIKVGKDDWSSFINSIKC